MPSIGTYSRSDRLLNCRIGSANRWEFWPLEKSDVSTGKIRYGYQKVPARIEKKRGRCRQPPGILFEATHATAVGRRRQNQRQGQPESSGADAKEEGGEEDDEDPGVRPRKRQLDEAEGGRGKGSLNKLYWILCIGSSETMQNDHLCLFSEIILKL